MTSPSGSITTTRADVSGAAASGPGAPSCQAFPSYIWTKGAGDGWALGNLVVEGGQGQHLSPGGEILPYGDPSVSDCPPSERKPAQTKVCGVQEARDLGEMGEALGNILTGSTWTGL